MPATARPSRQRSARPDQNAYRALSDFRYLIRRFLEFSQDAAGRAGLPPQQHQALLAIKGMPVGRLPTVGDLAERLRIQHHSAVELVNRLVEARLIVRVHDSHDRRRALLKLTRNAEKRLADLSATHMEELHSLRPALLEILHRVSEPPG